MAFITAYLKGKTWHLVLAVMSLKTVEVGHEQRSLE